MGTGKTMKIFEWLTSFIAWLQIVALPLIIGLLIGFFVYKNYPTATGFVVSICISTLGLIIGIIIATRIWKKRGTLDFVSGISASPDLDNLEDEKD